MTMELGGTLHHSRGAICVRVLQRSHPRKQEGAGNAGCLSHPQPCVQVKKARKQVTTGTPKRSGIPCAMVLRPTSCSRRSAGLDSLRGPARRVGPKADIDISQGSIPASGDHDHTTSASAPGPRSSARPKRPSHPAPTFVTIAKRPSCERGMRANIHFIYILKKRNIFNGGA
jgi:hypothetical protein